MFLFISDSNSDTLPESTTYGEYDDAFTSDYATEAEALTEKEVLIERQRPERRVVAHLIERTKNNVDEEVTEILDNAVVGDNKTERIDDIIVEEEYKDKDEEPVPDNKTESDRIIEEDFKDKEGEPVDGADHPCYRKCESGKTMECIYKFEIEWYQSMSKACYDCPFNATDCDRLDCIAADGVSRPLTVINRKMPGPSVQVRANIFLSSFCMTQYL